MTVPLRNMDALENNDMIFVCFLNKSGTVNCFGWFKREEDKYGDLLRWIQAVRSYDAQAKIRVRRDDKDVQLSGENQNTAISLKNADRVELQLL